MSHTMNNSRLYTYNVFRYNAEVPVDPDDQVIMESQCTKIYILRLK